MPCRTYRERLRPNFVVKRKLPISSAIRSFSSRVHMLMLISACARSTACAWVKCTMYTGACRAASRSVRVSVSGV